MKKMTFILAVLLISIASVHAKKGSFSAYVVCEKGKQQPCEMMDPFHGQPIRVHTKTKVSLEVKEASVVTGDHESYQINILLDESSTKLFGKLTADSLGKRVAVFLDRTPLLDLTVNSAIQSGRMVIHAPQGVDESDQMAVLQLCKKIDSSCATK